MGNGTLTEAGAAVGTLLGDGRAEVDGTGLANLDGVGLAEWPATDEAQLARKSAAATPRAATNGDLDLTDGTSK